MSGVDEEYVKARRVLLDALDALQDHRDAIVLVGAQAVYQYTGATVFAVAEYTTGADLALDPSALGTEPALEQAMQSGGFVQEPDQPGIWRSRFDNVEVDLMVPEALGGPGRRGARLKGHSKLAARKARGLEAALVDRAIMDIAALDPADPRSIRVAVAGPAALLVAKLHKIWERRNSPTRLDEKDAFDIYRLLQAISTADLARRLAVLLSDPLSNEVARDSMVYLRDLFSTPDASGSQLAGRYVVPLEDPDLVAASSAVLAQDLLAAIQQP